MSAETMQTLESIPQYPTRKDPQDRFDTLIKAAVDGGSTLVDELNSKFIPVYNTVVPILNDIDTQKATYLAVPAKAAEAAASTASAAASADTATVKAAEAAASASAAATEAGTAASQAAHADASAAAAAGSAGTASSKADEASASAGSAAVSATAAAASAGTAASSAEDADASAAAAAASAGTAGVNANDAANSADAASASATAAQTAQAGAEAARKDVQAIVGGEVVLETRTITAGAGLSGGGNLSADLTFSVNTAAISSVEAAANTIPRAGSDGKIDGGWLPETKNVVVMQTPHILGKQDIAVIGATYTAIVTSASVLSGVDIASFTLSLTGQAEQTVAATADSAQLTWTIPAETVSGTLLTMTVIATDSLGNTSEPAVKIFPALSSFIAAPVVLYPTATGSAWIGVKIVLGDFTPVGAADTWVKTEIRVRDAATSAVVFEALDLTGETVITAAQTYGYLFSAGQTVIIQARYHGANLGAGLWSDVSVTFAENLHGAVVADEGLAFGNTDGTPLAMSFLPSHVTSMFEVVPFASVRAAANLGSVVWDNGTASGINCLPNVALTTNVLDASGDHTSRGNCITSGTTDSQIQSAFPLETGCGLYNTSLLKYYKGGTRFAAALQAFEITVGGLQCALPSIPETCTLRRAGTFLTAQDPTTASYPAVDISSKNIWSSSENTSNYTWYVGFSGTVYNNSKSGTCSVVPVSTILCSPTGNVGGTEADPILLPNGRKLWVSESGKRWIMEYTRASGVRRKITGLWSNTRTATTFGTFDVDTALNAVTITGSTLDSLWNAATRGNYLTPNTTDVQIYTAFASETGDSKTNCDVWMTYADYTDSQSITGVPAVHYCRDLIVDGITFDLPNILDLCAVFCARQWIDLLDPFLSQQRTCALMNWGFGEKTTVWSASEYDAGHIWTVGYDGSVNSDAAKNTSAGVLPIAVLA